MIHVQNLSTEADDNFQVTDNATGTTLPFYLTKTGLLFAAPSHEAPHFQSYFPDLEELTDKYDFRHLPHRRSIKYEGQVQLENNGRWLPGMSALPIHAPQLQRPLPTHLLRSTQPPQLLPAHRRPSEVRRWAVFVLLPDLHVESVWRRDVVVSCVSESRTERHEDGV